MEKSKYPKTHQEALRQGVTYYYTGNPCKRGHVDLRFAKGRRCRQCVYERNRQRTITEDYWLDYGDEAYREKKRQAAREHYQKRKHYGTIRKRRAAEKKARNAVTKAGAIAIRRIKLEAQLLTIDSGVKHEVDHIIPLIHPIVCGLSVPANMQVLTKAANRRKAARFDQAKESKLQLQLIKKPPEGG